ncbi:MAG: PIN domain-containing protein [Nitrospirae bacterium]|nr:PIN domain-containing protein [Nitrospirota bacterium]
MVIPEYVKKFLQTHQIISLDTSIFIYFVEHNQQYYPICNLIFEKLEKGDIQVCTSSITLLEILVQPYRLKNDDLVLKFYSLLTTYPNIKWIDLTLSIADLAAKLRAEYRLKTPDSIQVASAISHGATGFICNDKAFKMIKEIECMVIDE